MSDGIFSKIRRIFIKSKKNQSQYPKPSQKEMTLQEYLCQTKRTQCLCDDHYKTSTNKKNEWFSINSKKLLSGKIIQCHHKGCKVKISSNEKRKETIWLRWRHNPKNEKMMFPDAWIWNEYVFDHPKTK